MIVAVFTNVRGIACFEIFTPRNPALGARKSAAKELISKEGKQFLELFITVVALNQAVLFRLFYHFAKFYVLPLVTCLGEFRFAYETYHTRILFFERYVRTCLLVFYLSVRISSSHDLNHLEACCELSQFK